MTIGAIVALVVIVGGIVLMVLNPGDLDDPTMQPPDTPEEQERRSKKHRNFPED